MVTLLLSGLTLVAKLYLDLIGLGELAHRKADPGMGSVGSQCSPGAGQDWRRLF